MRKRFLVAILVSGLFLSACGGGGGGGGGSSAPAASACTVTQEPLPLLGQLRLPCLFY